MPDDELEAFKTEVDLRHYAASIGYEWDRRESWRGSTVMRSGADKIIIKRNTNGHFVYFSVRDDGDNGTIIDFVQRRSRANLGTVRKLLRPWIGKDVAPLPQFPTLEKTGKDRLRIETEFVRMAPAIESPYLESRGLPRGLLQLPRFADRIRIDGRGNVVFPHFDLEGLCGYEIKNQNFTGFASGGEKGLWISNEKPDDASLVISESAIDALSHAILFPDSQARYASVGGKLSPRQPAMLWAAFDRLAPDAEVIAAMDSDTGGEHLAAMLKSIFSGSSRTDLRFRSHRPETVKDWNDELRALTDFPTLPAVLTVER
jgi:hypothetical protein